MPIIKSVVSITIATLYLGFGRFRFFTDCVYSNCSYTRSTYLHRFAELNGVETNSTSKIVKLAALIADFALIAFINQRSLIKRKYQHEKCRVAQSTIVDFRFSSHCCLEFQFLFRNLLS